MAQMGPSDPARRAVSICRVVRQHGGDGPAWPNLTCSRYLQNMPAWRRWVHLTQLDTQSLSAEHASVAEMGLSDPAGLAVIICGAVCQHGGDWLAQPGLTPSSYLRSMSAL